MWNQNYYISFLKHFKKFSHFVLYGWKSVILWTWLSHFSSLINAHNNKFPFITVQGRDFLINFAGNICLNFYISCKQVPNFCLGKQNSFFLRKTISLFAVKPNINALHSADLKLFFSEERKKNNKRNFNLWRNKFKLSNLMNKL